MNITFRMLLILLLIHNSKSLNSSSALVKKCDKSLSEMKLKADHAKEVVNKVYNAFRQWFFTVTYCEFTYFENGILKFMEIMGYGYPVLLLNGCPAANRTKVKPKINIHGKTAYVITSSVLNLDSSEYVLEALVSTGVFKPRSVVIFVLNEIVKIDSYFFFSMRNHFKFMWSKAITSSVVMIFWHGKLKTYAYNFFLDKILDVSKHDDITLFLTLQNDNLYGHEIKLSVFRKISAYDETTPLNCDAPLALVVMDKLNATCRPLEPRDGNTVGDLLSNRTATGVTADLMDGYTEIELQSRILKNSYYGYIDTTYPLMQDELCFMLKSPDKQSTYMTTIQMISITILSIFMFNVFALISIALIARETEMIIWNVKKKESRGSAVVNLLKCFIRQTVDMKFYGPVYRIVVMIIILYSLVVDCVIDGIITSAVTYPRYKSEINNLTQLFEHNFTLGVHNRYYDLFENSLSKNAKQKLQNHIETINDRKTIEIIVKRLFEYALLMKKSTALNISRKPSNMRNGRPIFQVVDECPVPCFIVYGLKYGSPYLPKIGKMLLHLNEAGILTYWLKSEEYRLQEHPYDPDAKLLRTLTLSNLQEVFIVWLIGLVVSTIAFLIELFVYWYQNVLHHHIRNVIK